MTSPTDKQGLLVLVAGPSGAGKDSVMAGAVQRLANHMPIRIAQRVITRAPEPDGEQNLEVSNVQFDQMKSEGAFLLDWEAHGLRYAVPNSILPALERGMTVLANISRTRITEGRACHGRAAVVLVHATDAVRVERLAKRGREAQLDQSARLTRQVNDIQPDLRIDNDGLLDDAVRELSDFILGRASAAVPS